MADSLRPKRVVIVDADNPLQEIHGEFFWREDHERALAEERQRAFREGYDEGLREASSNLRQVAVRRHRVTPLRLLWWLLIPAVVLSFVATLIGSMTR